MSTTPTTNATTSASDFVSFQVRDLDRSADFYGSVVGLPRVPAPNEGAAVFNTGPDSLPFAVRRPFPGTELDAASPAPGYGIGVWFHSPEPDAVHERVAQSGATVVQEPFDGPFGTQFSFTDPDGYTVTVHGDA
ncbi:MAG: VOC family protein [Corynebacterium sp.]|uniref:VOC family protein n=1 Tax=Corynebacterium sp. TaxID=1720 RepID=UPI003F99DAA6